MNTPRLQYLLGMYLQGDLKAAEKEELRKVVLDADTTRAVDALKGLIEQYSSLAGPVNTLEAEVMLKKILSVDAYVAEEKREIPVYRTSFLWRWGGVAVAASIILMLGIGAYLWTANKKITPSLIVAVPPADVAPGKNGAVLTLSDGSQVVLDSLSNGVIARQNGAQVVLKNGGLAYDPTGQLSAEVTYNTITTPKGRQFQVVLPDGTRIWLNAASSLRYPTVFTGKERKVEVNGEAYFEVAKNTQLPFRVNVNNKVSIEVLGTHFNVNAYENEEDINTTLLEGSVRVLPFRVVSSPGAVAGSSNRQPGQNEAIVLKPGQQAQLSMGALSYGQQPSSSQLIKVNNADIDKVMAWKNGLFNFEGATLEEIMRQVERWYDIEVVYEKGIPAKEFVGKMTRDVTLNGLLRNLGKLGVHGKLEGRKLVVLP